ncbi:MAG: adenine deaminase [Campylobacterota bacterium]|nr:adenine deaminase [Campylobacterota bacterium]
MIIKANYIDIKNSNIFPASILVENKKIISITKIEELLSTFILPGFIDAHIHIESSMMIPSQFAKIAVTHGTVATVSDPHEIANVLGEKGIEFMLSNASKVNFNFNFGVSSCVPATTFETSGSTLDSKIVDKLLHNPNLNHLGEVMAFPSVINGDKEILEKIESAKKLNIPIDGHAPNLRGKDLKKYIRSGITTDHESSSYEEAKEKLDLGMKILIREGSAAKNFDALSPLIDKYYKKLMFCSDDKHPNDLLKGHINSLVLKAVKKGYDLFNILQIACINPINHYNLDLGQLQIGDKADFIEIQDLTSFKIIRTVIAGEEVYIDGKNKINNVDVEPINKFNTKPKKIEEFIFKSDCDTIEVIQAIDHELFTKELKYHTKEDGIFSVDLSQDILKIAVINRYEDKKPAVSFVNGFGLKKGAIASCVAHDSHNIIVVGCSDEEICKAVNLIIESKGGISAVDTNSSLHLPLDIAGIMSSDDAFKVASLYEEIDNFSKKDLGSTLSSPFMTLSFMALLVIPEIKLSDKGLFNGREFHFISGCIKDRKNKIDS